MRDEGLAPESVREVGQLALDRGHQFRMPVPGVEHGDADRKGDVAAPLYIPQLGVERALA